MDMFPPGTKRRFIPKTNSRHDIAALHIGREVIHWFENFEEDESMSGADFIEAVNNWLDNEGQFISSEDRINEI